MVSARIDHQRRLRERIRVLSRLPMGQRQDDDVVPREHLGGRLLDRQMRQRAQVRLVLDQRLPRGRMRRDGADLHIGMGGQEPKDLTAGIAGCAGDGDRIGHAFHLSFEGVGA